MTYDNLNISEIQFLPKPTAHNFRDLTGQVFNRLSVLGIVDFQLYRNKRRPIWLCQCTCGKFVCVSTTNLPNGGVQSCGCWRDEQVRAKLTTHGQSNHPLYGTWISMHRRCYNEADKAYKHYGAKGITVCDRWHSVKNFIQDMHPRPSAKYTVERVDNKQGYSPDNCVWATSPEQARNTSRNRMYTYGGRTQCLTDWAIELNSTLATLLYRVKHWPLERALTEIPHHTEKYRAKQSIG